MKQCKFKLNALSAAMIIATSTGVQADDLAADTQAQETEVIQVKGIRSSLTKSASTKRYSDGVVDAISAEDIGKLPDTNLAESLQRIAGVSIDRANNEGNKVTVRGFGPEFNLVTLNGRQMPNSSALQSEGVSRSFNFREIAAESVSGVNVYKTGKADITSGGIGATIDITTARPFDYDGFKAFVSAKGIYDTSVETGDSVTPEISGMISQTFADDKVGFLLSASHAERDSHTDIVGTDGWVRNRSRDNVDLSAIDTNKNPEQAIWTPWTAKTELLDTERTRQNAQAVLQIQPVDSVIATVDYTISRFEQTSYTNRSAFWFDNPSGAANANGTLWNPRDQDDELNFWAWEYYEEKENDSLGLNIEWQATDTLKFELDVHDSTSKSNPDGQTAETLANLKNPSGSVALIGANFIGDIPEVIVDDSNLPGGAYNKDNIVSDLYQKRGYSMDNNIKQYRFSGTWENEASDSALTKINFGIMNTDYTIDTRLSEVFSFVDVPLDDLDLGFIPLGDTADQFPGANNLFPYISQYDVHQFIDIVKAEGLFAEPNIKTNGVNEETLAAYLSFDFDTEFNDMPVKMNVGVRYEDTDVTAYSVQNGIIAMNYRHAQELRPVYDDTPTAEELTGSYTRILPNFDFNMSVTDELVTRFSYSRTLSRAGISAMFPATNVSARPGGPFNASQGNPNLLPITSDNFDLSLEWYFDDGSFASAGYFKKYVENFIGAGTENRSINDVNGQALTDPSVNPRAGCPDASDTPNPNCLGQATDPVITWEVATPDNLQNREVDGWELNAQYMFWDSGFGAVANYTIVNSDESFDPYNFDQTIALTGLSDSGNLVAFYENDSFQARIAYNWRDEFLLALGNEPTFTEAYGQLDLSLSYDINDTFTVSFDGLNLTDETVRRYGRFEEQLLAAEQYGPRYTVGISAKF
ncbi:MULTISPECIES: TonB-dependent receptor [Shewanella]|uniref:TonB-dependent receptor n=1 Tax=Shewanella TaxID=22 RepID=UPI0006D66217|nr:MULTISPECIES: TonB-dependent receptor [Shewanella]KPZ70660.1 TonB dependent receptor [Shewanella sp. P1-14-1]MBQ4888846.1 TonB-dependent receptor [Shewanella sp. MMG014]OBT11455.1 TonB-dependent receptor [Shewanella sp. UCD-FRSSP16_17]